MNALKLGMVTAMIAYTMACLTSAAAPRKPIKEWFFSVRWDYLLSVCPVVISVN